jgi:hypothetical protein
MYQDFDEPIDVIALFEKSSLRPCRFRWRGKIYKVARVTGDWLSRVGENRMRHFAVIDSAANCFQLCYDEHKCDWTLAKVWVE